MVGQVPVIHPRFSIVVSVTDGRGEHPVQIEILHDDDEKGEVSDFKITGRLRMTDPLEVSDAVFNVVNYKITSLGRRTIRVTLGENGMIYQRAFQVIRGQPPLGRPANGGAGAGEGGGSA